MFLKKRSGRFLEPCPPFPLLAGPPSDHGQDEFHLLAVQQQLNSRRKLVVRLLTCGLERQFPARTRHGRLLLLLADAVGIVDLGNAILSLHFIL